MKILSIIVPAYNVENYLHKCLDSLIVDTILNDIEVLIINDGSKDKTADIAKTYCDKYPQTFHLYNKENGGHGSGINYGIRYATGKYFKVLDGDDWLNSADLVEYIELLKKRDEDIIASNYWCIEDHSEKILEEKKATSRSERYGTVCSLDVQDIFDAIKMHSMTIKTSILQKNNIVIDEHCFYVDCEYITYPIPFVETIYYDPHYIYCYRLGRNGQSVDIKSMQKNRKQHEKVLKQLLVFYDGLVEISEKKKRYIEMVIGQVMENQFQIFISMGLQKGIYTELRNWDKKLQKEYPGVANSTNKKSIILLRKTNYRILWFGSIVLKLLKG